jgi:LacI family transcriptional regulator
LSSARIPFVPELLVPSFSYATEHGYEAMRDWLRAQAGERLPTAIFCGNDGIALGALQALAEAGLRVPDDVSLAGFDDTIASRTCVPQLTSVRQPLRAMGSRAVELLLARIEHKLAPSAAPVVFPVEIVSRASTRPPSGADRIVPAVG